jgi:alpha-ketoglutarate-dependent taurine dioxygenase
MIHESRKHPLAMRRRSVGPSPLEWIEQRPLYPGTSLPLLVTPAAPDISLPDWLAEHWSALAPRLLEHGALLFRGFGINSAARLHRVVDATSAGALPYRERSSPRSPVQGNVYTSTDHPPDQSIFLHNEQSYNLTFPRRICFAAATPASTGGETPIADCRRVLARFDPALRRRFVEKKYRYVRNFGGGLGLDWQTAFETTSRAEVEAYCRQNTIAFAWRDGDRLRTQQIREPVARHPVTGELSWFNHATFFHVSTLPPAIRSALSAGGDDDLPNQTYYGDGSPIEPETLDALRAAYEAEKVSFAWQEGDLLVVDNLLVAHGRAQFMGPRLTLVAMSDPTRWEDCLPTGDAAGT